MDFIKEHWGLLAIVGVGVVVLLAMRSGSDDGITGDTWSGVGSARTAT